MESLKNNHFKLNLQPLNILNHSIYNSKKVNEQLESCSTLFIQNTPYLSKSFGHYTLQNVKPRIKHIILKGRKKIRNSRLKNKIFSKSPYLLKIKEEDRDKLSTYYKLTDDIEEDYSYVNASNNNLSNINISNINTSNNMSNNNISINNTITTKINNNENKEQKHLFTKYSIFCDNSNKIQLPKINESSISCTFLSTHFNNLNKAKNTIDVNKQIVNRMSDITNYFLIKKYKKGIEDYEKNEFFKKKMPKINIKNIDENEKEVVNPSLFEQNNNRMDSDGISRISMRVFKQFSFNGMLAVNNTELKKISKRIIHEVNALITYITPAYKPYSRSDFSINVYKNVAYLFGGLSSGYLNDIWEFDLLNYKWVKTPIKPDNEIPVPRYSHSTNVIGKNLVIYGGFTPKNYERQPEQFIYYDLENKLFVYPHFKKYQGYIQRKGHVSVAASNTMLIYGGMDCETGDILNSALIYDVRSCEFERLKYYGSKLPYLMYHSAVMVNNFHIYTTKNYTFYNIPDDIPDKGKNIIYGVYFFGGQNEKGDLKNDLYIIEIGKKPCRVFKPKIDGIPPEPRMSCAMEFILSYDFIVIHGGTGIDSKVLNDIMILNTESLNWIKPTFDYSGDKSPKNLIYRTEHKMFFYRGKIFILGGRDQENYLRMDFECIQFEITNF